MKLLYCPDCDDIIALHLKTRSCLCGKISGRYRFDMVAALYTGDNAIPLGVANSSFKEALNNQPKNGLGKEFTAFVIPKEAATFIKVDSLV